ncbi:SusD/RagB family nutrient-binding outer membrane lipoprotein [Aquiflexum sp.]|uniref:SusD/RagB family nutrient-binding outer membrane lipoprotein n=1 Tax=Aquiflexum sp. TaxID=1872584 RepID=UPI003592ECD7
MKSLINKSFAILLSFSTVLLSCSDDVMDRIDTNPNTPTSVNVRLLLPHTIMSVVYGVAGDFTARQVSFNMEHTSNVSVNNNFDPFFINESLWQSGYFALNDIDVLMDYAERNNFLFFKGIAQVLQVYTLSMLTDVYGDIPFSEALQGNAIRSPQFDSQEFIYSEMFRILDESIANISANSPDNPGNTDLMFNGNRNLWIKSAYALKARLHNRLSKIDANGSANAALSAISNSFVDHTEGFVFTRYQEGTAHDNPWAGFQKAQRVFAISESFINHMNNTSGDINNDPRAARWFNRINGSFVGAPVDNAPADPNFVAFSSPSTANVIGDDAPQPLVMFDELMFIKAEAHLRLGQQAQALTALRDAITANMRRNGIAEGDISAYITSLNLQSATLNNIIAQKYISFFLFNPVEAYNDWRRTGIPQLTSQVRQVQRLPYPNTETNRNPNTPTGINEATIYTTPVWWAR